MPGQSVLFLGGTGIISSACTARAVELGMDVFVLNRGRASTSRPLPDGVTSLVGDLKDADSVREAVDGREFDVVADFLAFTPTDVSSRLDVLRDRMGQYVFISSASAYQTPPGRLPIVESTPLRNPFWQYSRDKIACEDLLTAAYRDTGFPATVVRPSHTYDRTLVPFDGGWTVLGRMRAGKPVVVHGDGTSLWTLTHSDDFAVAFTGLLGHPAALGEAFTITGTHAPTWNQIYTWLAEAAGVSDPRLVHVASETIAAWDPELGPGLVGDKAHSMVFDNAKVTALVPAFRTTITFDEGARRILSWYDAHPERQRIDEARDALFDRMVAHADAAGR